MPSDSGSLNTICGLSYVTCQHEVNQTKQLFKLTRKEIFTHRAATYSENLIPCAREPVTCCACRHQSPVQFNENLVDCASAI